MSREKLSRETLLYEDCEDCQKKVAPKLLDKIITTEKLGLGEITLYQVEVMRVQEASLHAVNDSRTDCQRPPVQNPQRSLLIQSQILEGTTTTTVQTSAVYDLVLSSSPSFIFPMASLRETQPSASVLYIQYYI
ncbi:hypothetical protein F7725_006059 [Dissostichus mawsoni]|uniref:Uncharacterized protein n=1 Tax=Dissostichus mawsoni TaxID=36200 RepID=A0A7J5YSY5_DISMA|nr:hypothetical protein F7725_006059 [Dissostichus mawsoni]